MKQVEISLRLICRDDVPMDVVNWMARSLGNHALLEFRDDYAPEFTAGSEGPAKGYKGPPVVNVMDVAVLHMTTIPNDETLGGR